MIVCDYCGNPVIDGERITPVYIPPVNPGEPTPEGFTGASQLQLHTEGCLQPWTDSAIKIKGKRNTGANA